MKLAVISDIHGNVPALAAVIADLERERPDRVVVAGDLVNRGPESRQVLEIVTSRGWETIAGNHDWLIADWARGDVPPEWRADPWYAPLGWVAARLTDWASYLAALPFQMRVAVDGAPPVLVVHGSPRHNREGLSRKMTDDELAETMDGTAESLVVCAHTHKPMDRQLDGRRIVNVGAVGVPFNGDPRAQYGLFTASDGNWHVDLRAVKYDRRAARDAFAASGYLGAGLAARIFRRELEDAKSYLYRFEHWAEAVGRPKDEDAWRDYLTDAQPCRARG